VRQQNSNSDDLLKAIMVHHVTMVHGAEDKGAGDDEWRRYMAMLVTIAVMEMLWMKVRGGEEEYQNDVQVAVKMLVRVFTIKTTRKDKYTHTFIHPPTRTYIQFMHIIWEG
jgi:hypothetical protein